MGWRTVWPNKRMERSSGSFDPLYDLRWKAYSKFNEKSSHFYSSWDSFSLPVIKYVFSSLFFSSPLKQQLLQTCHALSEFCLLEVKVETETGQLPNNTQAKVLWNSIKQRTDHSTQTWKQCKTSFDTLTLVCYLALHLTSPFHGMPFVDPSFDVLDSHFRKPYTMFIHCGFPPSSSRAQRKPGQCCFVCTTLHSVWLSAVPQSLLPSNGLAIWKVLTCYTRNHPGGNWSWWGPGDGTSLTWSQLSQDLNVVIVNQAQQWKNNWGQCRPMWGGEMGAKQLFLSRDVPNIHQKFTQGTHGCLLKDFISLEEKTQKNNRIANFLGGGSV